MLGVSVVFFLTNSLVYLMPNTDNPTWIYYLVIVFYLVMVGMTFATYYSAVTTSVSYLVPP
jgi:hypothetical protein